MEAAGEILPPFCVSGAAVARVCDWGGEQGERRSGTRRKGHVGAISAVLLVIQWAFFIRFLQNLYNSLANGWFKSAHNPNSMCEVGVSPNE